ncbi:hypothetical protein [uncultured Erythrobacter sp.]|uniref:hypothetical protein n=1 Tax=uncultured Erythrobacter sp. TaxID=263913 RepID=UPI00265AEF5F|nr:hypothetical protein [uncultured Erythrobacter sp.]
MEAIKAAAPGADVRFRSGFYPSEAAVQAAGTDVVIVFATTWATEGLDQPDLTLLRGPPADHLPGERGRSPAPQG